MKEYFQVMTKVEPKSGNVSFAVSGLYDMHCDACKELESIQNLFIQRENSEDYDCSEERNGNDELYWFTLWVNDLKITGWVDTREVIPPKRKYEVSVEYHTCVTQEVWASSEEEAKELFDETLIDFNNEVLNECERHVEIVD